MTRYLQSLSAIFLVASFALSFSLDAHADVKAQMSAGEFSAAGLEKLSATELAALSAWIESRNAPTAMQAPANVSSPVILAPLPVIPAKAPEVPASNQQPTTALDAPEARFGQEQIVEPVAEDIPEQISAHLQGEFRGWDGQTVFRLDNGQVWRQRVGGKYRSPRRTDPEVLVEKGRFGYYMKVVESGRTVAVKRVR